MNRQYPRLLLVIVPLVLPLLATVGEASPEAGKVVVANRASGTISVICSVTRSTFGSISVVR